jgi:hypothetical protein
MVRKLVIAGLVVGAAVAGWLWLEREPEPAELFQRANPGWTIATADGRPARVDDASGKGALMLSHDDLGPARIRRVDCEEVRKVWPAWFVLPDVPLGNCARLDGEDGTRWVLDVTTPMPVTQIWDRHFEPRLDRLKLGYNGGRSGRFPEGAETDLPAGQAPPEERGAGGYLVDPPFGSGERVVAIAFYRWAGTTELVFTFRPPPAPSPDSSPSSPSSSAPP